MRYNAGMDRKKLIKRLIYLIFFILIVNFLANKFHWYFSVWYLDMIMHFLGGFWVGLLALYIFPLTEKSSHIIWKVLSFVFIVGIGWEIFEMIVNDVIAKNPFDLLDTSSDIFFDLAGGAFAVFYFLRRILITTPDPSSPRRGGFFFS